MPTGEEQNLSGVAWEEFFRSVDHRQSRKHFSSSSKLLTSPNHNNNEDDVAMLPYRKATCYGNCSVAEAPKLVKCQDCNLVIKTVAFGHHQKIHHGLSPSPTRRSASSDSESDDDCQGFLLSPPHYSSSNMSNSSAASDTMLDLKIIGDTKWRHSSPDKLKATMEGKLTNVKSNKILQARQQSPPCYEVQQKNDLRLVLTKRNPRTRMKNKSTLSTPLVSISITHSSSGKRNRIRIANQSPPISKQRHSVQMEKAPAKTPIGNESIDQKLRQQQKNCPDSNVINCWPAQNGVADTFTADLEDSEQSSIPLHHSPSESSDSGGEECDIEENVFGGGSCSGNSANFVREVSRQLNNSSNNSAWDPRKAAERPSVQDKANKIAIIQKLQHPINKPSSSVDVRDKCNNLDRMIEQSPSTAGLKRIAMEERERQKQPDKTLTSTTGNSGLHVVEKLFKIQGISVTAISSDATRKLSVASPEKPTQIPMNTNDIESYECANQSVVGRTEPHRDRSNICVGTKSTRNEGLINREKMSLPFNSVIQTPPKAPFRVHNKPSSLSISPSSESTYSSSNVSADEYLSSSRSFELHPLSVSADAAGLRQRFVMEQRDSNKNAQMSSNSIRRQNSADEGGGVVIEQRERNSLNKLLPINESRTEPTQQRVVPFFAKRQKEQQQASSPIATMPSLATRQQPQQQHQTQQSQSAPRKTSTPYSGTGVSWRRLDSVTPPQQSHEATITTLVNRSHPSPKSTRFVPVAVPENHDNVMEYQGADVNARKMQKAPPLGGIYRHSSSPQLYRDNREVVDGSRQSVSINASEQQTLPASHQQQQAASRNAPTAAPSVIRKRNFPQQQQQQQHVVPTHHHHQQQQPIAKRFRPIAPRQTESVKLYTAVDEKSRSFSIQQKLGGLPPQQHCRPNNSFVHHQQQQQFVSNSSTFAKRQPSIDQRHLQQQQQIFNVFPPVPNAACTSSRVHVEQIQMEDSRVFSRQPRQFAIKQPSLRHFRAQPTFPGYNEIRTPNFNNMRLVYDQQHQSISMDNSDDFQPQMLPTHAQHMAYSHSQIPKASCLHQQQSPICEPYGLDFVQCSQSAYRHSLDEACVSSAISAFVGGAFAHPAVYNPSPSVPRRVPPTVVPQQQQFYHQQQCQHNCARVAHLQHQAAAPQFHCGGGVAGFIGGGMVAAQPGPVELAAATAHRQQQQQYHVGPPQPYNVPEHIQPQQQAPLMAYNNGIESEMHGIEPPPILEAEGNIAVSEEMAIPFEREDAGGGATTRSESDASDMDLREILQQ